MRSNRVWLRKLTKRRPAIRYVANKIAVVVCAKNEEKRIEGCLNRLKKQIFPCQIIVVDGMSRDKTVQIAKRYADIVISDKGKGLAAARNLGWQVAKDADVVAYCDADSRPRTNWTAKINKIFNENLSVIGISGPLLPYDGNKLLKLNLKIWANYFPRAAAVFRIPFIWGANMAFRRYALERCPFRQSFLEDYELAQRMKKFGLVRFYPELGLPCSTRRFRAGFYKICYEYYLKNYFRMKLGKKPVGYYFCYF